MSMRFQPRCAFVHSLTLPAPAGGTTRRMTAPTEEVAPTGPNYLRNLVSRMARPNAPARRGYLGLILAALVASPLFVMSDHALAWQTEIDGTANSTDLVRSVAVDAGGDVIAGGFI